MTQPKRENADDITAPLILIVAGFILILIVLIWQIFLSLTKDYRRSDTEPTSTSNTLCQGSSPSCLENALGDFADRVMVRGNTRLTVSKKFGAHLQNQFCLAGRAARNSAAIARNLKTASEITSDNFA